MATLADKRPHTRMMRTGGDECALRNGITVAFGLRCEPHWRDSEKTIDITMPPLKISGS
jgi:hypothetical protein